MKLSVKKALANLGLYHPALGIKIHPPEKAALLLAHKGNRGIFVETGTETGDMIECMRPHFKKIYSIELDTAWYEKAKARFAGAPEVVLLRGDSGEKIKEVLQEIREPALFWLDAHASGAILINGPDAAPVEKEMVAILDHFVANHAILIDDARHFNRAAISRLKCLVEAHGYQFWIEQGLMIALPSAATSEGRNGL